MVIFLLILVVDYTPPDIDRLFPCHYSKRIPLRCKFLIKSFPMKKYSCLVDLHFFLLLIHRMTGSDVSVNNDINQMTMDI